jgi:hypothetical protein
MTRQQIMSPWWASEGPTPESEAPVSKFVNVLTTKVRGWMHSLSKSESTRVPIGKFKVRVQKERS